MKTRLWTVFNWSNTVKKLHLKLDVVFFFYNMITIRFYFEEYISDSFK